MKRILISIVLIVVILVGTQAVGYIVAINSDAYAAGSRFVLEDATISKQIGHVADVTLGPLDAEIRFTANTGEAKFVMSAKTASGTHKVLVRLEKTQAGWRVLNSTILT